MEKQEMHFQLDPSSLSHEKQMDVFLEQTKRLEELTGLVKALQTENKRLKEERESLFDQSIEYLTLGKIFQHFFWHSLNAPIKCIEMAEAVGLSFRSGRYVASTGFVKKMLDDDATDFIVKDGSVYIIFSFKTEDGIDLGISQYTVKPGLVEQFDVAPEDFEKFDFETNEGELKWNQTQYSSEFKESFSDVISVLQARLPE